MYETIDVRRGDDGVVFLALNRVDRLNALSLQLADELLQALDGLDADLDARVLVLHGNGRAFCAGLDLKEGLDVWREPVGRVQARYRLQQHFSRITLRLREIHQPVIAAVHGAAAGAGLSFAAAADIRIADSTARFNAGFTQIGLSGGDLGTSWMLPRAIGSSAAAEVLYTGRFIEAAAALEMGLVSQVVEPGQHVPAAAALAREIAANPPLSIRMTKELLNASLDAPGLRQALDLENRTQMLCALTEDFEEGVEAFQQRRDPIFRDR